MLLSRLTGLEVIRSLELVKHLKALKLRNDYDPLVAPDCFCGIEIEVEGLGRVLPEINPVIWEAKRDNSLRNGGVEFISRPVAGNDLLQSLDYFFNQLPAHALFSPRTSIHVHINVLDLELENIECFVILYLLFEKLLYRFVGKDRDRSIFCVPLQDTYRVSQLITDLRIKLAAGLSVEHEERRYAGLNLASLFKFGTFEFRQLGGTRDMRRVIIWINILQSLRNHALAWNIEELKQQIMQLNTTSDYRIFLSQIFGKASVHFNSDYVDKDMEQGVYAVKHSLTEKNNQTKMKPDNDSSGMKFLINLNKSVVDYEFEPVVFANFIGIR
ncbi:MAG: amidoligase family protein [Candidatus Berkelbacteria bacterium]|nr:amidoligase family protein [Candidatus Berkelbacteria bacterium]